MRYEKKTGPQNDDPTQKSSAYASGLLETYGKWTQRYGYFEARMKLPTAPGLWPAFWMMPDRGAAAGAQGKRQDTANGGMEFDIMEHLTRWGGLRYNIAMHWDSYAQGKHKQTGTERIYVQPDKDGFITAGLLWLPGLAVYYGNGREVGRWEDPRISNVPSDMMFTLPTGGWDNSRLEDAKLPDDFTIDPLGPGCAAGGRAFWRRAGPGRDGDRRSRANRATRGAESKGGVRTAQQADRSASAAWGDASTGAC